MAGYRAPIWSCLRCKACADIRAGRIGIVVIYKVDRARAAITSAASADNQ